MFIENTGSSFDSNEIEILLDTEREIVSIDYNKSL